MIKIEEARESYNNEERKNELAKYEKWQDERILKAKENGENECLCSVSYGSIGWDKYGEEHIEKYRKAGYKLKLEQRYSGGVLQNPLYYLKW